MVKALGQRFGLQKEAQTHQAASLSPSSSALARYIMKQDREEQYHVQLVFGRGCPCRREDVSYVSRSLEAVPPTNKHV
jgi:hypothetical protein